MNGLEPLVTVCPSTGAFRSITADMLSETYLTPQINPVDLNSILSIEGQPWSASMAVSPVETAFAVSSGLKALAMATQNLSPDDVDLSSLDQESRIYRHLSALCDLWRQFPYALPKDLQVFDYILRSSSSEALEPLTLVNSNHCVFASTIEHRLQQHLLDHHGLADPHFVKEWEKRKAPLLIGAKKESSLWRVQRGLLGAEVTPAPIDTSLQIFALRDEAEEADFAAARAQKLIDNGISPANITLLVPDEVGYFSQIHRAFESMGVPVSGLPDLPNRRDIAGETLLHLLLCLQSPAPAMAIASLYISPLMPWPADAGLEMAREVMQGRFEPFVTKQFTGSQKQLFKLLKLGAVQTSSGVLEALEQVSQCLNTASDLRDDTNSFRTKLSTIRGLLSNGNPLEWQNLYRVATPVITNSTPTQTFIEGVNVLIEGTLPQRPSQHMIAMGMSSNRWPRPISATPLFLDGELNIIRKHTGLRIQTRSEALASRLEKLRRQFLATTESLTLLRPVLSTGGLPQSPAPCLSLVARTIGNHGKASEDVDNIIQNLRSTPAEHWPFLSREIVPKNDEIAKTLPDDGVLRLDRDLLRWRLTDNGKMRPQSPSRLETLLVSPLAWSLSEFGAAPVIWAPEDLNVMVAGTIAHEVLEHLFPKNNALPDTIKITSATPNLLTAAIRKHAPFLQASIWAIERQGLERDIRAAAIVWSSTLKKLGARIIDNEIDLNGEALGILLRGRADCLLQLGDNSLLVVDHKKSGTPNRRARLEAGWDLQLGLYRAMLMQPGEIGPVLAAAIASTPKIGVAYHMINDQGVLLEGLEPPAGVVTVMDENISGQAIELLKTRLEQVGDGNIVLNHEQDRDFFKKIARLAPYGLDASILVSRFTIPSSKLSEGLENGYE
jgi:hypothetical protein